MALSPTQVSLARRLVAGAVGGQHRLRRRGGGPAQAAAAAWRGGEARRACRRGGSGRRGSGGGGGGGQRGIAQPDPGHQPGAHGRVVHPGRVVASAFLLRVEVPQEQLLVGREGDLDDPGRLQDRVGIADREAGVVGGADPVARAREPGGVRLRSGDLEDQPWINGRPARRHRCQYLAGRLGRRVDADRQGLPGDGAADGVGVGARLGHDGQPQRAVDGAVDRVAEVHHRVLLAGGGRVECHRLVEGEDIAARIQECLVEQLILGLGGGVEGQRRLVVGDGGDRQDSQAVLDQKRHLAGLDLGAGGQSEGWLQRPAVVGEGDQAVAGRGGLQRDA